MPALKSNPKAYIVFPAIASFVFLCVHLIGGILHYHECDSSGVYTHLRAENFITNAVQLYNHISGTSPKPLTYLRYALAGINQYNFIAPLRHSISLSLVTTYPPVEGLIYGIFVPSSYQLFYQFASVVTGIAATYHPFLFTFLFL